MNDVENALIVVIEECAEITEQISHLQKAASKSLRFGLDSMGPDGRTNREALVSEANDLIGSLEHLADLESLDGLWDRDQIKRKKDKIAHFRNSVLNPPVD